MRILLLLAVLIQPALANKGQTETFGSAPVITTAVPISEVVAAPDNYKGKEILLEGSVHKVCQKKGCWTILSDGEKHIRVTFKDYGFFLPKNASGKQARAQGLLVRQTLSAKTLRHYLKDEGAPKADINKVKGPADTISFVASGVTLVD